MRDSKKKCIIILGTHRSGASALTKVLQKCGVYLGATRPPKDSTQKENFENQKLYQFNIQMLAKYNYTWSDLVHHIDFSDEDVEELKKLIVSEFEGKGVFAIKEPTMIYLFPLYAKALNELDININFLLLYRNPLEVAAALNLKDGFSKDKGVFIWTYNFLLAEKYSREYNRSLVRFDELVDYTSAVVFKIGKILDIDVEVSDKLDGYLQSRFKYRHLEDELNRYDDLGLPTIVSQIRHFGDDSQTRLYDQYLSNIIDKVSFVDNIGMNHCDFWRNTADASVHELHELRIEWQIKDQELQTKSRKVLQMDSELESRDIDLVKRENALTDKEKELQHRETELNHKDTILQSKSSELQEKAASLQEKEQLLQIKESVLNVKDEELRTKENQVQSMDEQIQVQAQELGVKEHELQTKTMIVQAQLHELQNEHLELQVNFQQLQEKLEGKKTWLGRMFMK